MAVTHYEPLGSTDVTTTKTLLHESIPLTGTIVSGTYGTFPDDSNVKNYTHGMFQSVYDYPYLSSSANHIFDLTAGFGANSVLSGGANIVQQSKKINIYNQLSQLLLGYTSSANTIRNFEADLLLDQSGSVMKEAFFVNFSRLLYKDEMKPGSFSMTLGTGSWATAMASTITLVDASASQGVQGIKNTQGGNYGVLYSNASGSDGNTAHGVVFYQAGIAILSSSVFASTTFFNSGSKLSGSGATPLSVEGSFVSASISGSCDALRHRVKNVSFNNTTEINSTIYFCRVPANKYNYSANPTYVSSSKIVVKSVASDTPVSYITTVGLYNASNELLAIAKLSEPLKKDPSNEITLRVRLDY